MINCVRGDSRRESENEYSFALIKLTDITLNANSLKTPETKIFCKISYGEKELITRPLYPNKTTEEFEIKVVLGKQVHMIFYSSEFLYDNTEVGSCEFIILDRKSAKISKPIVFQNSTIGNIEISISFIKKKYNSTTQSTCNSLDMRDEDIKDLTHLDLDIFKPMNFFSHFHDTKDKILDTSADESNEQIMHNYIEKVSTKRQKILEEKQELSLLKQSLDARSQNLITEKYKLDKESEKIREEQSKIEKKIFQLNSDFLQLKCDKLRNRAHKKLIEQMKRKIAENLNRLGKEKSLINSKKLINSNYIANLDYSILGLSESVMPINNSESPIPDECFFESPE